jgi:hypothetical protein
MKKTGKTEMKPHKHADIIHAWAEGAEIEVLFSEGEEWYVDEHPDWYEHYKYRIKTEIKDDVVLFKYIKFWRGNILAYEDRKPNMKYVFDGETGWLKSAEVLK